jgi:hypothetical protein
VVNVEMRTGPETVRPCNLYRRAGACGRVRLRARNLSGTQDCL